MLREDNNNEQYNQEMPMIIDSIIKDIQLQQLGLPFDNIEDFDRFIDRGIMRKEGDEYFFDMYLIRGIDYTKVNYETIMDLGNYQQVLVTNGNDFELGLDSDMAVNDVLYLFPELTIATGRIFMLPEEVYIPFSEGGLDLSKCVPVETDESEEFNTDESDESEESSLGEQNKPITSINVNDLGIDAELLAEMSLILGGDLDELHSDEPHLHNQDISSEMDVGIYLWVGLDIDKVHRDGIDLEDKSSYLSVNPAQEDLEELGIDLEDILTEVGATDEDEVYITFLSLPEEYYLSSSEGGYDYQHFNDLQDNELDDLDDYYSDAYHYSDSELEDDELLYDDLHQILVEEEMQLQAIVEEVRKLAQIEVLKFNQEIIEDLEKVRKSGDVDGLNKLDTRLYSSIFRTGIRQAMELKGYFIQEEEYLGVCLKTIYFILDIEGQSGVWIIGYTGTYAVNGKEGIYEELTRVMPKMSEFKLDDVVNLSEEELGDFMSNG